MMLASYRDIKIQSFLFHLNLYPIVSRDYTDKRNNIQFLLYLLVSVLVCECIFFILFIYPRVYVNVTIKLKYVKFRTLQISTYMLQTLKLAEIVAFRHCLWRFPCLFFFFTMFPSCTHRLCSGGCCVLVCYRIMLIAFI